MPTTHRGNLTHINNIISFPVQEPELTKRISPDSVIPTPKSDKVLANAEHLKQVSKYPCDYDFEIYRNLELRFADHQPRGGIIFGGGEPFKIVNTHPACQQCLYGFEMDTYGRGCVHDCAYCYSRAELIVHGYWNKPFPMPRDITSIWNEFYTVFETSKKSKWRSILEKRIPLRIGSGSDGFMHQDRKYRVTYELLKILKYYNYPYIIVTRSDLVAYDDYIDVMDPKLASIQISIPSINDDLNKLIEPGAPNSIRRLNAIRKLVNNGFWTTVRINPLFPIHPDGYFSDPNFPKEKRKLKFDLFSWDIVQAVAEHGGQSLLAGFVRLSNHGFNNIQKRTGIDLYPFFKKDCRKSKRDYHYSEQEIRAYYERLHSLCKLHGVQFTTCYIGNGESMFWKDQDLWDNKFDCCNAHNRVERFNHNAREIDYDLRLKLSSIKCNPVNDKLISQKLGNIDHLSLYQQYQPTQPELQ